MTALLPHRLKNTEDTAKKYSNFYIDEVKILLLGEKTRMEAQCSCENAKNQNFDSENLSEEQIVRKFCTNRINKRDALKEIWFRNAKKIKKAKKLIDSIEESRKIRINLFFLLLCKPYAFLHTLLYAMIECSNFFSFSSYLKLLMKLSFANDPSHH